MDIQELNSMIADFVQVGYMEAVKAYEPPQDFIRLSEVKRWLRMMKIDIKRFNMLVANEIIKPVRKGTSRNKEGFINGQCRQDYCERYCKTNQLKNKDYEFD